MNQPPDLVPSPVEDISRIRWDQGTFLGRLNHFSQITDPRLLLKSRQDVEAAQHLYHLAKEGHVPGGTTQTQLYHAQTLYHSAVHPDTDEIMHPLGRMSALAPFRTLITGMLLVLYQTTPQVVLAQFINQTFNAFVNYTNRNAKSPTTNKQIVKSYVSAMTGAVGVSVIANRLVKGAPPLVGRFVPFLAVATANCINIPMMRQGEIARGVIVMDKDGHQLGKSRRAAVQGIAQVCLSRVTIAASGLFVIPIIMQRLEHYKFFRRGLVFSAVVQTLLSGIVLVTMVPVGCALFPQTSSIEVERLEKHLREQILRTSPSTKIVFFNKGL